ncbi:cupin domain-containing protein [Roseateles saccharophilus]|nr:cupin domain-containing protein [Roseateles saccharophilus]MDG0835901.1 hypothetical protein [Roseateles saccharophilus]
MSPLLSEPFARAWAAPAPGGQSALGERLSGRLRQSLAAERGMVTVRRRKASPEPLTEGVQQRWLYRAPADRPLRPGEPLAARVVELAAGASLQLPAMAGARELLVVRGRVDVDGETLGLCDFLVLPQGSAARLASREGAHVFVREAQQPVEGRTLVRDAEAGWPEFAPGIRRRVLWSGGGQAALLYRAEPGAGVPGHGHGHDEECLMVQGELFLDDLLLQQGDYQLAPAGTGHRVTETDTGVIIYAHGDLDLQFT